MTVEVGAVVQTRQRVLVTVTGVPAGGAVLEVRRQAWTSDPVFSTTVRGTGGTPLEGDPVVVIDHEAPFGAPVAYSAVWRTAAGVVSTSALSPAVLIEVNYPRISDPITGAHAEMTVETWPTLDVETGTVVLDVHTYAGPAPLVVAGPARAAASQLVVRLDPGQAGGPVALRALLETGRGVLLRAPLPTIKGYLAVTRWAESRITQDPRDPRRRFTLDVRIVSPPEGGTAAAQSTLTDLAAAVPDTLTDIAATWPTLRDIAVADLGA